MAGRIAAGIARMQAAGEVAPELDAGRTAAAILAGIQGGVVMLMSTGDLTPLEAALDLGHRAPAALTRWPGVQPCL